MSRAYGWAFLHPALKIFYYNVSIRKAGRVEERWTG
jgi:high-affinity nickel permease